MTACIKIFYFKCVLKYHTKKVGIIHDTARSICSKSIIEYMNEWNNIPINTYKCYAECGNTCLSIIYQPPDVMYNTPFKTLIQKNI